MMWTEHCKRAPQGRGFFIHFAACARCVFTQYTTLFHRSRVSVMIGKKAECSMVEFIYEIIDQPN